MQDATQLVRILRTSKSLDEITEAARELAQSDNQADRQELYRMAQGNHRKWLSWYNADFIWIGIEALTETGNKEVTDFIERLLVYDMKFEDSVFSHQVASEKQYPNQFPDEAFLSTWTFSYPNAPKKLRLPCHVIRAESLFERDYPPIEPRVKSVKDINRLRQVIDVSLNKLKFIINGFALMKSELHKEGPKYFLIEEFKAKK